MTITYTHYPTTTVRNYWPENNNNTLYVCGDTKTISELTEMAKKYFGIKYNPDKITIQGKKIHTYDIDYDSYEPNADWTNFIIITLSE